MSSTKTPAILVENPKGENESWQQWGEKLAEKYKTPAATPNLPPVPGHDKLRASFPILSCLLINPNNSIPLAAETWKEYGTQWEVYYNTKVAGKPINTKEGPTLPALPSTEASGNEWLAWGKAVADTWTAYAAEKGVDLAKVVEGLKVPEAPAADGDWAAYAAQWGDYGKQVGERFKAALAAKSA